MKISRPLVYFLALCIVLLYFLSFFLSGKNPVWADIRTLISALGVLALAINVSPTLKRKWESFLKSTRLSIGLPEYTVNNSTHQNDLRKSLLARSEKKCRKLIAENQRTIIEKDDFHEIGIDLVQYASYTDLYNGEPDPTPLATISTQPPPNDEGFFHYLLTGEAGHGKTYTLLNWMKAGIDQKKALLKKDKTATPKIPVYIQLNTWSFEETMTGYLTFAIQKSYGMNLAEAGWLVQHMHIIPYLDGLDEVDPDYQRSCLQAILHYARSNSVVFTCRKEVLDDIIDEEIGEFDGEMAIFLMQDLSRETILQIIRSSSRLHDDASLISYIHTNDTIIKHLTTSLMLSLFVQTFTTLKNKTSVASLDEEQLLNLLWKTYVDIKLSTGGQSRVSRWKDPLPMEDPEEKKARRISYMVSMSNHMEGNVFFLDKIQPDWLPHNRTRILYYLVSRLITGLILAIAIGFIIATPGELIGNGLFASLLVTLLTLCIHRWEKDNPWPWSRTVPLFCLVLTVGCGLYQGLVVKRAPADMQLNGYFSWTDALSGITLGMIYGALFGYRKNMQSSGKDIQPLHLLKFDLRSSTLVGLRASIWMGVFIGSAAIAIRAVIPESDFYRSIGNILQPTYHFLEQFCSFFPDIVNEYIVFFIFGFFAAFISSFIIFAIMGARDRSRSYVPDENRLENKFLLNYGIRRSARIALRSGLLGFLLLSFIYGTALISFTRDLNRSVRSVMIGIGIGLISFLWYGGSK